MEINELAWLEDIIEKIEYKHNIQQCEVKELLENKPHFRFIEKGHRTGENVYAAMGQTYSGRYLIIFFIYKSNNRAMLLSARDMTKAERKLYAKK